MLYTKRGLDDQGVIQAMHSESAIPIMIQFAVNDVGVTHETLLQTAFLSNPTAPRPRHLALQLFY